LPLRRAGGDRDGGDVWASNWPSSVIANASAGPIRRLNTSETAGRTGAPEADENISTTAASTAAGNQGDTVDTFGEEYDSGSPRSRPRSIITVPLPTLIPQR
jgi:hypothetical protein